MVFPEKETSFWKLHPANNRKKIKRVV